MDPQVRRAALRAAAKTAIALSLGGAHLAGCAGSHERSRAETPVDASMTPDAWIGTDAAVPIEVVDAGLADCDEHLASLPRTSDDVWAARFERVDAHTGECCMELHTIAERGEPTGAGEAVDMACCYVVTDAPYYVGFSPLGCTPWGPPCPPEMGPTIA